MSQIDEIKFTEFANYQEKQKEAHELVKKYKYTLYGGSAAGGKSYFLRWEAIYLLLYYSKKYNIDGIRVGLFCEDYPALRDRHLSKIQFEFPEWLGTLNKAEHEFTLRKEYGSGVIALRNLDDTSKYLSSEFAAVLIDELTKNKREVFDFLNMRMRWAGISDTKFIGATNPGGIGMGWVKKLWINRDFRDESFDPNEFVFLPAKFSDNKYIDVSYKKQLDSLPDKLRQAYRDGNWDIFEGQFFTEFNREQHIIKNDFLSDLQTRIWWDKLPIYAGMDYGYTKPACVLWGKYDKDTDTWYIYKELYVREHDYKQLSREITLKGLPQILYPDPSMFAKKDSPTSGIDQMNLECGVRSAFNDRNTGWTILRQYLKDGRLKIFPNCLNLIRTLPEMVYDETHEEDLDTEGEDHAVDALRYLIATHKHILPQQNMENYAYRDQVRNSDFAELFTNYEG